MQQNRLLKVSMTARNLRVDLDNIKVEKKAGTSIRDSKLVKGIVLDKEVVHSGMPKEDRKGKNCSDKFCPRDRENGDER